MFPLYSSPSKEASKATRTLSSHPQHPSSPQLASMSSSSSPSVSPLPSEVETSQRPSTRSSKGETSFISSILSPTTFVSPNPGSAPTIAPEPTPRQISFRANSASGSTSNTAASHFDDVHQGLLESQRDEQSIPNTPKALFTSAGKSNQNTSLNSDSSTEDLPQMMSMMMGGNLPPPQPHRYPKSRRKSRSTRRTSSSSQRSSSTNLSNSLLLDGYDEGCSSLPSQQQHHHRLRTPLAVRRRSSQRDDVRRTSSKSVTGGCSGIPLIPEPTAFVSPSSSDCYSHGSSNLCYHNSQQRSPHDLSSSSPKTTSESSPDSSPNCSSVNRSKQQYYSARKQGSFSSTPQVPGNIIDPSVNSLSYSFPGFGNLQGVVKTMRKKWNNKSWCLTGTFWGMILMSLMGTVLLTNQATVVDVYELQEQSIHRPDVFLSSAGLRGKMVQGHWDDKPLPTSNKKKSISKGVQATASKKSKQTSEPMKSPSKQENVKTSPTIKSKTITNEMPAASMVPVRLQMRMPPPMSLPEAKFEGTDPNLYEKKPTAKLRKPHPRIVMLDPSLSQVVRKIKIYPADFTDNTQLYGILPSEDERLSRMEIRAPYSDGECVPMQEWQTTFHPYCNGMHELALESLGASGGDEVGVAAEPNQDVAFENPLGGLDAWLFGTHGFWRYAWKLNIDSFDKPQIAKDTIVLKTLKYEHNFEDAHFEHDRVDAVAMERLTSSPHVINIFGFCGHSVLTEYADGSRVGELADKAKKKPMERLRIARDIANGLADVHGIDGDGNATFVHLDVNPANVVSVGGTLKLNDFNIGIIRRWNTTSNEPCGFPAQYPNPQWRSPEEARNEKHLTEKVDIFSMGHIFFRLICGHEPWNKLEPGGKPSKEDITVKVQQGKLPYIPDHVMNSENPEVIAIRDAMLGCYKPNPKDRPSAREIAKQLDSVLAKLSQNRDVINKP